MIELWAFRLLFIFFVSLFVAQMATRLRLIFRAKNNFSLDDPAGRIRRFISEVVFQSKVIAGRPIAGVAHALVFWGFVMFGGFTTSLFLQRLAGRGSVLDITEAHWFYLYKLAIVPFAVAVLVGILYLLFRRVVLRPEGLG